MTSKMTESDHKLLADIVYLDLTPELQKKYDQGGLTIGELAGHYQNSLGDLEDYRGRFNSDVEFEQYKETILSLSEPSSKYHDWKINHIVNNNDSTGFVAYTFEPKDGEAVIAFRGSEAMEEPKHLNTDWKNNGTTLFEDVTVQQAEAIKYLNDIGLKYDSISVTGHSLGGNNSLAGSLLANDAIREKIWAVRTFNAPGFNKEFLNTHDDRIAEMRTRIQEFQNEDDLVSSIMFNPTEAIIIETNLMVSDGLKRFLDPFLQLTDSHALRHMAADGNGNLIRKDYQLKNFTNHFVSNLTQGFQMLPNNLLGGFVETTFALLNGRVSLDSVMKGALLLTVISPVGTLAAGIVTIKTIVTVAAAVLIVTMAMTMRDYAMMAVDQFSKKVYQQVTDYLDQLFARLIVEGVKAAIKLHEFKEMVKEQVNAFLLKAANAIAKWWKSVGGGSREVIEVNTGHLKAVAARLANVQQRINRVDSRLNSLRKMAQLDDKISIALLDFRVGYDNELRSVINYLNFTADKLEESERMLSWKARGI